MNCLFGRKRDGKWFEKKCYTTIKFVAAFFAKKDCYIHYSCRYITKNKMSRTTFTDQVYTCFASLVEILKPPKKGQETPTI